MNDALKSKVNAYLRSVGITGDAVSVDLCPQNYGEYASLDIEYRNGNGHPAWVELTDADVAGFLAFLATQGE